mmetsp:Transcript_7115/g.10488  ORF Transcript_7115/g.10488 Transcript_7115/m.10488 type:complete len:504 (-) Transcript_7115:5455-6966(-)
MESDEDYLTKTLGGFRPIQLTISLLILNATIMNTTSLFLFMCSRRKLQPLKIRSVALVSLTLFSQSLWIGMLTVFNVLGENNVPCFVQRIAHYVTLPLIVVPYILRSLRILFVFRLNQAKTRSFQESINIDKNGILRSQFEGDIKEEDEDEEEEEEAPKSFLQPSKKKKQQQQQHQKKKTIISLWETHFEKRLSKISGLLKLILKTPILVTLLFLSLIIVAAGGIGGELLYNAQEILQFSESCENNTYVFSRYSEIFVMMYMCINVGVLLFIMIFIRFVKEQFGMVNQLKITIINYIMMCLFICIYFVIPSSRFRLVIPFVWVIFPFLTFDSIIGGWIPTLNTLKSSYGFNWGLEVPDTSSLLDILRHDTSRTYFYLYTQREFSTENLHFWLDVSHYQRQFSKLQDKENINYIATRILNIYFTSKSPMELNIPQSIRKKYLADLINKTINPAVVTKTYFDTALELIEHNMMDTYSRFIHHTLFQEMIDALTDMNMRAKELGMV